MKDLVDRVEPFIWTLFGAGFVVGSLVLPAWIFVLGIAAPLGWVPAEALAFGRVHDELAANLVGRLVLLALIVLPLWNAVNHLRHFSIDLGNYDKDGVVAPALYGAAAVVSAVAVVAVVRL